MIPIGTHKATVVCGDLTVASTGNEQVAVVLEFGDRQTLTWWGYFTDKTIDSTLKALRLCGWTGDDVGDLTMLGGAEVTAVVEHERGKDGDMRARVRWINPVGGQSLDGERRAALSSRVKAALGKKKDAGDDIPF